MKRLNLLLLALLTAPLMVGCGGSKDKYVRPLVDDRIFDVEIPTIETPITDIKVLNIPKTAIEVGYMSYMGIELQINYADGTKTTIPFTEKLFPVDQLEMLKTPGKKYIDFLFQGNHISFDLTLKEAAVPVYHEVKFVDYNNSLLYKKLYGYLEEATYGGDEIPDYRDNNYYYAFADAWSVDTTFVYRDFTTKALYKQEDLRNYGNKYREKIQLTTQEGDTYAYYAFPRMKLTREGVYTYAPKALFYMGDVKNFEIAHSQAIYHKQGSYDRVDDTAETIDDLDLINPIIEMTKNVYRLGDKEETAIYKSGYIQNGNRLTIDTSLDENNKPKGIADAIDSAYGSIPNRKRTDGHIISHDPILKKEVMDDVKSLIKPTSLAIYEGKNYPTGYYRISYVVNLDLLLDVYFYENSSISIPEYHVAKATLVPCLDYSSGSCRALLSYSESGRFDEKHSETITVDIDDLRSLLLAE